MRVFPVISPGFHFRFVSSGVIWWFRLYFNHETTRKNTKQEFTRYGSGSPGAFCSTCNPHGITTQSLSLPVLTRFNLHGIRTQSLSLPVLTRFKSERHKNQSLSLPVLTRLNPHGIRTQSLSLPVLTRLNILSNLKAVFHSAAIRESPYLRAGY